LRLLQIDAFTDRPFKGNPAAVCLLDRERDAIWMQSVAAEMNLSETAFLLARPDGWSLRWFTPTVEVDLCGHATLASAHALWSEWMLDPADIAYFHTRSGVLTATLIDNYIELDFPATLEAHSDAPPTIGWIGTHTTLPYLEAIAPALEELATRYRFKLKVVGGGRGLNLRGV